MRGTMRSAAFLIALGMVAVAAAGVPAQEATAARQVFASDSLSAAHAQLSPDGRWLVMRVENATGARLWMAPAGGGDPFPLTSEGFDDRIPLWFGSGDRIAFGSTRPNRNGGRHLYMMVLAIDPATGRAAGGPRQVGTEPMSLSWAPSPDGRLLAYIAAEAPHALKVVPANGGMARELVPSTSNAMAVFFGPDSRHVYYHQSESGGTRFTIRRAPVAGGAAEVVASADHRIRILAGDPRYVTHFVAPNEWEVRHLDGTRVGTARLPEGTRTAGQTADGLGLIGIDAGWTASVRVVPVEGGEPRVLAEGSEHWPEAWLPDGSAVITDRSAAGELVVDVLPLSGTGSRSVRLPAGAVQSGWQSSVGPWFSYRIAKPGTGANAEDAIHAVNVLTGEHREVAPSAIRIGFRGRGGYEQDGSRWVYFARPSAGGPVEFRSIDPAGGTSALIRRFPADFAPVGPVSVHGDRTAWMVARGDSVDLMLAVGPTAEPRRIGTFSRDGDTVTWSWDGTRIAVADWLPGTPRRGGVWTLTVGTDGTPQGEWRRYDLGVENGCDGFAWTPDDRHILTLCYGDSGRILRLRLSDGELGIVVPSEVPQQVWEYYLSPDGRHVAYPVQSDAGSSVHVLDLKPMLRSR